MVSFRQLHSHLKLLLNNDLKGTRTECGFKRAFTTLSDQDVETFIGTMFLNVGKQKSNLTKKNFKRLDPWVNERQMQTTEEKVDISKALDASLVNTDSNGTEFGKQDTSSSAENVVDADDADIKPVYDEEPMAETMRAKIIEHTTYLIAQNAEFKAQLQEKGFAIAALKNELRKLTGNSVNTKFAKLSILGKPVLQSLRNQSVVIQLTAFKSERPRISKPRFASQVDVNNDLSKPITAHYLHKEIESAFAKPHHVIPSSESRNNSKNMPRFSSNDMNHNHYLDEARKKTQEKGTSINVQEEQTLDLNAVIMEYLVNISKRRAFWSLNEDILKITILKTNTSYPSRKIRRIRACTHQRPQRNEVQYACMTTSSNSELFTHYEEPEREFRSSRRHFKTLSLDELRSPNFNLFFDQEYSEEEEAKALAETMEQYMSKTRTNYGSGVARPKIEEKDSFELIGQFLKELRENTFSGSDNEDANEHIEKVLKIVDLFHVPNITEDQLMLRVFPISLTGAASHWLRNEPTSSIKT
ncbi:hypothetical protein Tco_0138561 [Tanacetum coccineum]